MTPVSMDRPKLRQEVGGLFKIAAPLIISNLFFTLQMLIDRVMLSWYDTDAMAAALAASMLAWLLIIFCQNTVAFATTFVAQYVGADRPHRVGAIVNQALYLAVAIGLVALLLLPLSPYYYRLSGHEPKLLKLEETYGWYMTLCLPSMVVTGAATSFFAGRGQTWIIILVNAIGTLVNGVLDYGLIFGRWGLPELGITGAGIATALGCAATALAAVTLYFRPRFNAEYRTLSDWRFDVGLMRQLLRYGVPNGVGSSLDVLSWTLFTVFIGWLGAAPLAATSLVFNVNASFLVPMLGLAQAVQVLVGQRLGQNRADLAERITWIGFIISTGVMTALAVLLALFPEWAIAAFEPESKTPVWEATVAMIPTLMIFMAAYTFFDAAQILLSFALRGAGDTWFVMVLPFSLGVVCLIAPAAWICYHGHSLYWVWAVATGYLAILSAGYFIRFRYGPWRSMRVIDTEPRVIGAETMIEKKSGGRQPAEVPAESLT